MSGGLARPFAWPPIIAPAAYDPAAAQAIMRAIMGTGPGAEFASVIRSQVRNLNSVVAGFLSGRITEFTTPGVAVRAPGWNSSFVPVAGRFDHLRLVAAGGLIMPDKSLQLGVIVDGPFDEAVPAVVMFGIDRGGRRAPIFASRPGLTPDAVVIVVVGPYGQSASGAVVDLRTGAASSLDASRIRVEGPTVRAFVPLAQLPSAGQTAQRYRFTAWMQDRGGLDLAAVASFLPDAKMVQVGVAPRPRGR
jgi:hypothetical protein